MFFGQGCTVVATDTSKWYPSMVTYAKKFEKKIIFASGRRTLTLLTE